MHNNKYINNISLPVSGGGGGFLQSDGFTGSISALVALKVLKHFSENGTQPRCLLMY